MSRLYDRMRRRGKWQPVFVGPQSEWGFEFENMRAAMEGRIVLSLDNVARYFWEHWDKSWNFSDFPNIAPPFDVCFAEWKMPRVRSFLESEAAKNRTENFEAAAQEWEHSLTSELPDALGALVVAHDLTKEQEKYAEMFEAFPKLKWDLILFLFAELYGVAYGPFGRLNVLVNADGSATSLPGDSGYVEAAVPEPGFPSMEVESMYRQHWMSMYLPLLLGMSLMHCKNTEVVENRPPAKLSRKHEKRYGCPLTKYRVLTIDAMKRTLRTEGKLGEVGLKKALHICRGHFAHYSEDKPLFGKYSGTFWKPQHVRGSKKHGEVIKDYAVKGPGS